MSITASDIICYGANVMAETDATANVGGAIDKTVKMVFTALAANDTFDVVSDDADDNSQTVTITGRLADGSIDTEVFNLDGTNLQTGSTTFERLLKAVVSATYEGTITITEHSGGTTVATMEGSDDAPGGTAVLEVRRLFYGAVAAAEAAGAGDKLLYEKVFIANTHATLALTTAEIELTNDGTTSNILDFDLEGSVNDTNSVADRTTEPAGADMLGAPTWDDSKKAVPGNQLGDRTTGTSDHIGVWMRLDLDDGEAAEKATFTLTVTGNTT